MISRIYKKLKNYFYYLVNSPHKYTQVIVADIPSILDNNKVYVVGVKGNYWLAVMKCPCGCGDTLHMNLIDSHRPCWKLAISKDHTISFKPSLWRKSGCRSHFFIRNGEVIWAK
jgi:hypothetical protein